MDHRQELRAGAVLDRKYRIERVIGFGGFGITYAAHDIGLATGVAIKEYYPTQFAMRDSTLSIHPASANERPLFERMRASFLREARTLARFDHPAIVRVLNVFEAHGTAYMVMKLETGPSLKAWRAGLGRRPTQVEIDRIAGEMMDALEVMHTAEFLHRDIAPDNIIIRDDGSAVLLDFGATRRVAGEMSGALTGIVKRGYSPQEQYSSDSRIQGPWTDIYSLAGTLYYALTGTQPIDATERMLDDGLQPLSSLEAGNYRSGFLAAIDWGMQLRPSERPQSIAAWRKRMFAKESSIPAAARPSARAAQPDISQPRTPAPVDSIAQTRSTARITWIAAAVLLAIIGMGTLMLRAGGIIGTPATVESSQDRVDPGVEARKLAERLAAETEARRQREENERKAREETARLAAAAEAKRKQDEAEQRAREEAARLAAAAEAKRKQDEAERKAREEAARLAAAEAKRKQDEAERKAREEAARLAAAAEAKRKQDEAERKAREEAARLAAAAEAKRKQDEAERKAREEAARLAAAAEAKRKQDEAERKAREEAARLAAAAEAKRKQDEAEQRAREEAARLAAAAEAKRRQDEAEQKAREEAERQRAASSVIAPDNRIKLVADIRKELNRVGCETPARAPGWTDDDQRALQRFVRHAGTAFSFTELNEEIADAVGSYVGRVCPAQCSTGESASRDRCIAGPVAVTPVQCSQINERAQLGSLTEEDRDILRSGKCRN